MFHLPVGKMAVVLGGPLSRPVCNGEEMFPAPLL